MSARPLTPRQLDVLAVYGTTWSRKRTACRLGISEAMVCRHLDAIHARLDVATTGEAFVRLGWLRVPEDDAETVTRRPHRCPESR